MTCCPHCQDADRYFDRRAAESELRQYHRHGPTGTTKRLLDMLTSLGVTGMTLLDVGGGIGVLQHELHAAGVIDVTDVDASRAYLEFARQEAEKRGYADRARYVYGDFVALADQLEAADIVTLDRVLCCYPDVEALVTAAAGKAARFLGLVYPRDTVWTKLGVAVLNAFYRLQGNAFRNYIHPTATVERLAAGYGLRSIARYKGIIWQVALYARQPLAD